MTIKIYFQPNVTDTLPEGYLKDIGYAYGDRGNGYSYGWDIDDFQTRVRNHTDFRYATLNHRPTILKKGS